MPWHSHLPLRSDISLASISPIPLPTSAPPRPTAPHLFQKHLCPTITNSALGDHIRPWYALKFPDFPITLQSLCPVGNPYFLSPNANRDWFWTRVPSGTPIRFVRATFGKFSLVKCRESWMLFCPMSRICNVAFSNLKNLECCLLQSLMLFRARGLVADHFRFESWPERWFRALFESKTIAGETRLLSNLTNLEYAFF
jgi:hypothetical protein